MEFTTFYQPYVKPIHNKYVYPQNCVIEISRNTRLRELIEIVTRDISRNNELLDIMNSDERLARVQTPMFEVATNPTIRLSDVKARRFYIIDNDELDLYFRIKGFFRRIWVKVSEFFSRMLFVYVIWEDRKVFKQTVEIVENMKKFQLDLKSRNGDV